MTDLLYSVGKNCPVCNREFMVTQVRSRLVKLKEDSDFCSYFRGVNPYYYTVWVCPHCGYAAQDSLFYKLAAGELAKISKFLHQRDVKLDLTGVRTREQAIDAYKLAIFYEELIDIKASRLGGLYLRMAWLAREGEDTAAEQRALRRAVECYEQALFREKLPIGHMTEVTLTYMVGELFRRIGEEDKALPYFSKVVSSPQAKLEGRILTMARDGWQKIRATRRNNESQTV